MNKFIRLALAGLLVLGSVSAQAQTSTAKTSSRSGSQAVADVAAVGTIIMPGALGGAGAGGAAAAAASSSGLFNQPQMIMSTGSAPSTSTFNECGIAFSGGLWVLTLSYTGESKSCVAQRQALLALQMGQGNMAFELMCGGTDDWKAAAERTAAKGLPTPECQSTIAARAKIAGNQPRPVAPVAVAPVAAPMALPVPMRNACFNREGTEVRAGSRDANCWDVPLS